MLIADKYCMFFSWICCKWFTAMERDGPYCWCFGLSALDFLWNIFDETGTLWTVGHWESSSNFFLPSVTTSLDIFLKYPSLVLFYFCVIRETPSSVLNLSIAAKNFLNCRASSYSITEFCLVLKVIKIMYRCWSGEITLDIFNYL